MTDPAHLRFSREHIVVMSAPNGARRMPGDHSALPLTSAEIATFELKPREEDPGSDEAGVRMGTMKRIKGLEFRAVAMACADPADPMNNLDEAEIRDFCRAKIAHFKIPEHIRFVDEFPMTVTGKVQKFLIREKEIELRGLEKTAGVETA